MSETPTVLFAPILRTEGWTSIELQQQDILGALRGLPQPPEISVVRVAEGLSCLPFGRPFLRDVVYPRAVRRQAARLGRCVLHVSDHSYGHLCAAHSPCVVNCNDLQHHRQSELSPFHLRRWRQRVEGLRRADRILTISAHLAHEVREHFKLPEDRVVALPGGVNPGVFRPSAAGDDRALLPTMASLRATHQLVLNIGTNAPRKNIPTLLRALRELTQGQRRPTKLVKVGPRLRGGEHEPLILELGLADAIVDLGPLPPLQVAAACRLAHVLSFPSLYEGYGRPTIEAQACGLPCVLSDASCMREVGASGALYHTPTDAGALAHALASVLDDSALRARLVAAGLANAAQASWPRYAERLLALYRELMP